VQRFDERVEHDGREAHRELVQDQQSRLGHEPSADRAHLLLAAAHAARGLPLPLLEDGKQRVDPREVPPDAVGVATPVRAQDQVLAHGHVRKEPPPFGHLGDSERDDRLGRTAGDVVAVEEDVSADRPDDATHGVEQR